MYPSRSRSTSGSEEHQQQQQLPVSQPPLQYSHPAQMDVHDWQDPSMFFATTQASEYLGAAGLPQGFPAGAAYNHELAWMQPFTAAPGDINLHVAANLAPYQQLPTHQHRTQSVSLDTSRPPMLRSQSAVMDLADSSSDHQDSVSPEDAGQPGSSAAAAAGAETSRRSTPSARYSSRPRLEEENRLLLDLRDRQRLPWREVTRRFEVTYGREYRMPTLQMRYGRLRQSNQANRTREWAEADTEALRQAWQWYMEERWRIIAERMQQFGATEQWTAEDCESAWQQLTGSRPPGGGSAGS